MNWILSISAALISAIIGLLCAGFIADACVSWYHISSREGNSGFFVVFLALFGGIAGLIVGLIAARVVVADPAAGFGKMVLCSSGTVLGIAGISAMLCYLFADIPPTLGGDKLRLEVEIKLPTGHAKPEGEGEFELSSTLNRTQRASRNGPLKVDQAREEDERWVIPAEAPVFTARGQRGIHATLGKEEIATFIVPLPAHPTAAQEQWSDWLPQPREGSPPWPDSKSAYRFRVQRIPPPPPPLSPAEYDAQEEVRKQAEFDALTADTPLTNWLSYTTYGANEKRRDAAIQRIVARPQWQRELAALMIDQDADRVSEALRVIEHLPDPRDGLNEAVIAAGRDIIARIKKVNETTAAQDPGYDGAADASIRFSSWMSATRVLREKAKGDFTPELREILELSRLRTDSYVMQQDIRRVASYYLQQWAGVEPLPGDPPPR